MKRLILSLCTVLMAIAAPAVAQPLKPNILVVFDTSGSMTYNAWEDTRQDGSPLCGGAGQNRRIYVLKQAMAAALSEIGTDEANFGLARFPQVDNPALTPVCPSGHYTSADAQTGIAVTGGSQPFLPGCRMSTHADPNPETTFGPWFRNGMRDAIVLDVTRQFSPQLGPVAADFDPPDGNLYKFYEWIDQVETSNGVTITQPEIRAGPQGAGGNGLPAGTSGAWATPLGRSLLYSRLYFDNLIYPNDPKKACRQNIVILVTDGQESCDPAPTNVLTEYGINPTTCANTGARNYPPLHPVIQACRLLNGTAGVKTYVLTDNSLVAGNNPVAAAGGTNTAIGVDLTNTNAIKQKLIEIIADNVPPIEVCNGVDDDCDSLIDEDPIPGAGATCDCGGVVTAQQDGKGDCKLGVTMCQGVTGLQCVGCVGPKAELCNNADDNCNGAVDETFNKGALCNNGQMGICRRGATTVCSTNGNDVSCPVMAITPGVELCNGLDDNCNGMTDDGTVAGVGDVCGVEIGECRAGTFSCKSGKLECSTMMSMGSDELCDGKDNNCNGQADEGLGGGECVPSTQPWTLAQLKTGECRVGTLVCKGQVPLACEGAIGPRDEICDGKDNNCDGVADEGSDLCVAGRICLMAKCQLLCQDSEFPCPVGFACDTASKPNICRSTKCQGVDCDPGFRCDEGDGICKNPCQGVVCQEPKTCFEGECGDCTTRPSLCSATELCLEGRCKQDPCASVSCGVDQLCVAGECINNCNGKCAAGERCLNGSCQPDACAQKTCNGGDVCDPKNGACVANICRLKICPGQSKCVPLTGECIDDPCASTRCPNACNDNLCPSGCLLCMMTVDGAPSCAPQLTCALKVTTTRIRTEGGGGCSCELSAQPGENKPWPLVVATMVFFGLRRRRRKL